MAEPTFGRMGYVNDQNQFVPTNTRAQDVIASNGVSAEAHITDAEKHLTADQRSKIEGAVQSTQLGAVNGVAQLDGNGKLVTSQIPDELLGKLSYRGTFDPTTGKDFEGNDLPAASKANKGWYWIASAEGKYTMPGDSEQTDFTVGDWAVSNGTGYNEVDNSTADPVARASAAAAQTAADNAQTAADNAQTTANTANTNALKLDAVHCTDETDMATKNLRVGALVLMDVTNTAPGNT